MFSLLQRLCQLPALFSNILNNHIISRLKSDKTLTPRQPDVSKTALLQCSNGKSLHYLGDFSGGRNSLRTMIKIKNKD
jgi:hypothetical protein